MNRLQVVLKYTTLREKIKNPLRYWKAQSLKQRIIKIQDEKIRRSK